MNTRSRFPRALLALLVTPAIVSAGEKFKAQGGDIEITPIVHSSVQIEHAGRVIQVDPWSFGGLPDAKSADLILITDDVGHHLDPKAVEKLRKPGAPVVMPESGKAQIKDGIVVANGATVMAAGIQVEAVAAYDIKPGAPEHPKGDANGYVITLGGKRVYVAGVTECVPEVKALRNIDIAFLPMNIPQERMTPSATAECARAFHPKVVYLYHYDQDFASHAINGPLQPRWIAPGTTVAQSLQAFKDAMKGSGIEVRDGRFYP